ncbi:hypothetical protein K7711_01895 [Nocardia sp. CA2R105]|uniref:WXG100 family type VII secretion target n=1 Tax=Nocardia coffeae TaxID=2873381 RepID=UPI001CA790DE|nr:hypothetical protein [Nocardia coffeae]MBY8855223.1 hypothetical protein [Nocardia coffeae]
MSKPVEVDTAKLRQAAGTMNDVTSRVTTIVTTLKNGLNAKGFPWGHDHYGNKFTEGDSGYTNSSKNLVQGADNMVGSLGKFGTGMTDAAQKMDDMDH